MLLLLCFIFAILLWFSKWLFYIAIGLFTAALFCRDKNAAIRRERRIPERTLLLFSLLGGAFGAVITIFLIRHKSAKPEFYIPVLIFSGIHIVLLMLL
ncbi:MAG: DUF1294 domain-containing protein [Lentisphaeria bacterium]|nr:DUF1294 domain-containing protein [Lentisphaeria bacterium]